MIINSNSNGFLRPILPDHILIQFCFQDMRCRNILNIKFRLHLLIVFGLLLQFLPLGNLVLDIHHVIHIHTAGKKILNIHSLHQIRIVAAIHYSKTAFHAINTDTHIVHIRNMQHTSCLTLRTSAHIADVLVFWFIFCVLYIIFIVITHEI